MKDKPGLSGIAILSALFFALLSINSLAAQDFIIENKTSALISLAALITSFLMIKKIKEKNGSHSLANAPDKTLVSTKTEDTKPNVFKYLSVDKGALTELGSHSLAIALDSGSSVLRRHAGSNFFPKGMEFPPPASKIIFSIFALILFSAILSPNSLAAQDFIIENKTSALFVVNGTTGDVLIAPVFGKVGINTTSPRSALHVIGTLNATPAGSIYGTSLYVNTTGSILYNNKEICTAENGVCNAAAGGWTDDGTAIRLTTISDFVGIGTLTPTEKLYVSGNGTYTGDLVLGGDLLFTGGQGSGANSLGWVDDGTKVRLATASDSVGIGTASPNEKLVVIGNVNISGTLNVSGKVSFPNLASCTEALETDSNGVVVCGTDAGGASDIRNSTAWNRSSTNVILANIGDNVGIGTSSPQNTLEIIGAATFAGGVNASSLNVTGFSITDDSLVTLSDGSKKKIKDIVAGEEVLTLDEKTGRIVSMKVNALLDHGIKPIYEMATEDGRAINTTAEHPYFVKLYEQELCDKYAGNVWNKEADEFNGVESEEASLPGTCTRWVEVKDLSEGTEIAVPKIEEKQITQISSFSILPISSAVVYTLTSGCCLRCGSFDQIAALMDNASARKSASSESGSAFAATSRKSSYSESLKNLIAFSASACLISNSCFDNLDLNKQSSLCSSNSDLMNSGAEKSALRIENKYAAADFGAITENSILLSNTSSIFYSNALRLFSGERPESSSSLFSGESSASNRLNLPFFAFLPNSTDHLVNSCSSLESSCSSSFLRKASLLTFSDKNSLVTSDQLISRKESILLFKSSEIDNVIFGIVAPPDSLNSVYSVNVVEQLYKPFGSDITFVKITSIKQLPEQHVYDLSIEGTRNFIANDIVAHNTYLATSSGNVGIGTTASTSKLTVIGGVNVTGGLNVTTGDVLLGVTSGNVGIGTTSPQNKLEIIGAATFAGGVNASSLNVTGFSITDDSLITLSDGSKKKIKDVKAGEYVLTLDEKTGRIVSMKVNALLDHGIKPIYEMATEDGRAINTTAEHPYFVRINQSASEKLSSLTTQVLPLILSESFSKNFETGDLSLENVGGCMRKTAIKGNFDGGNSEVFRKSLSRDNIALDSLHANEYSLEFLMPFSAYLMSTPLSERNLINLASTSSSEKNLNLDINKPFTSQSLSGVMQGCLDMFFGQGGVSLNDVFEAFSSFKHFQNGMDSNSGALESGLSMADFRVSDNEFINLGSHADSNDNSVFKSYDNSNELGEWIEVRYLKIGDEIAVPDYSTGAIKFEKIASIKALEPQHVYDLSIEGTRNFIANDIVAHNTYLATSSGKVGIGTTSPLSTLHVNGTGAQGGLMVTNASGYAILFVNLTNQSVGIGTTVPTTNLDVAGPVKSGTIFNSGIRVRRDTATGLTQYGIINYNGGSLRLLSILEGDGVDGDIYFDRHNAGSGNVKTSMVIGGSGNVGIGTTTPTDKLQVMGNFSVRNQSDETKVFLFVSNATGRVGIGTTSPAFPLDVPKGADAVGSVIAGFGTPTVSGGIYFSTQNTINFMYGSNANAVGYINYEGYQAGTTQFRDLSIGDGKRNTIMFVDGSAGNVGIGTTSPKTLLHIDDTTAGDSNILILESEDGSVGEFDQIVFRVVGGINATGIRSEITASGDKSLQFLTSSDDTTKSENLPVRMTIDHAGNVGIGTTAPLSLLHVNDSSVGGALRVTNVSGTTIFFVNGSSGNTGIGTTAPSAKLHVVGSNVAGGAGGTITDITENGVNYRVHTFTSSGTFTPPAGVSAVEYLVVGGGGSGGNTQSGGGGGGAGGFRTGGIPIIGGTGYTVTIGAGGAAVANGNLTNGTNGLNSVFGPITSLGGGGGSGDVSPGYSGGSGGGGATSAGAGGPGTAGQGYNGGAGSAQIGLGEESGGGGGGAGALGSDGVINAGGNGGTGLSSSISGTATFYAGGGGGATNINAATQGAGGTGGGGGGGKRGTSTGTAGSANTGGGGGGGGDLGSGAGGSGIVIARYIAPAAIFQGSVGIWTAVPGGPLHVAGMGDVIFNQSGNVGIGTTSPGYLLTIANTTGSGLSLNVSNVLYVNGSSGRVGIGTTGPSQLLSVIGGNSIFGGTNGQYIGILGTGETQGLRLSSSASGYKEIQSFETEPLYINRQGNNVILNAESGKVGIGTTAPTETLTVVGTANITSTLYKGTSAYNNPDIAEMIPSSQKLESGDIVIVDPVSYNKVLRSNAKFQTAVGVVSPNATMVIGDWKGGFSGEKIAMFGRILVKVTNESGMVKAGDLLTTSSTEGSGMKCISRQECSNEILGIAMQNQTLAYDKILAVIKR